MTKAHFSGKGERASDLLGLIHSDVCGPMNTQARESTWKKYQSTSSDRGGEYLSQDFDELLKECGIVSQLTPPGTPQWNGVSERINQTLLDMVRSMMSHTDLPTSFWSYALETAAFTLNRVPSKSVQKTPHEMWTGKRPGKAYVKHQMSTKLEPKSHKCTFVGYPKETKGYYFFNSKENKVFVARTGVFLEKEFLSNSGNGRNIELEEVQEQQINEPEVEPTSQVVEENSTNLETQPLRRSTRESHEPERYGFLVTTHGDVILVDQDEPKTYQEAVSSPDSEKWLETMRSEMDSMPENQTYKGRLVAKGFRQIHGVDYDETFSPVAMIKSIRILLAIAAFHDYEIWQMDVKTAFLNGKLEEDVSIYGLKQASRSWNLHFNDAIKEFGFIRNEDEPRVYKKISGNIVSFLIFMTSQYQANLAEGHWIAVKNILKYLRRTKDVFLVYGGEEDLGIKGYTNASFQTDKDDSRSQSGFVFCLNGGVVSWKSSKKDTVADSTTEAEYIAVSEAAKEVVWIKKFISELGVVPCISNAIELHCDNNGAIVQAKEPRSHQRSKHILRRFHLIREIIDRGDVETCKVQTDDNIAEPLMKPLAQQKHDHHTESLSIRYVSELS
ncbi:hypothetical protein V6N12_050649 [Hibiscus sabdariffa]|uniref:Integrase catalytic domain-containing protein n=1 Tax=Hibiscus sabdariffa TaxID=183260 RepID=A0ABR2GD08_9ROSI